MIGCWLTRRDSSAVAHPEIHCIRNATYQNENLRLATSSTAIATEGQKIVVGCTCQGTGRNETIKDVTCQDQPAIHELARTHKSNPSTTKTQFLHTLSKNAHNVLTDVTGQSSYFSLGKQHNRMQPCPLKNYNT